MLNEPKLAMLTTPANDNQCLQVQIFPGATARHLLEALKKYPNFSGNIDLDSAQVAIAVNGLYAPFDINEDMYPTLHEGSILELMTSEPPVVG